MAFSERRTLGASARARIEENFSLGAVVKRYAALYKKLMLKKAMG